MRLARIMLFTRNMARMRRFYGKILGLKERLDPSYPPSEWVEYQAGSCRIALHLITWKVKNKPFAGKIVFYSRNVPALRKKLLSRGAKMGKIPDWGKLVTCDFYDPDGNRIQISNR